MKISIIKIAFLISAVMHLVMLHLVSVNVSSSSLLDSAPTRNFITARIIAEPRSYATPEFSSQRTAIARQPNTTRGASTGVESASPRLLEAAQQKEAPSDLYALEPAGFVSRSPHQNEASETPNVADEQVETDVKRLFSICRAITLPKTWVQSVKIFPRKYNLEFTIERQSEGVAFVVQNLTPEDPELPYADRLIKRVFENCMNKLGEQTLLTIEERLLALNPEPIAAYSLKIEFDTALAHAGQSKGI